MKLKNKTEQQPYVNVPDTVCPEAQEFLRTLRDPALSPAFPDPADLAGWKKLQAWAEADGTAKSEPLLKRFEHTVTEGRLGGVPVLDVRPKGWKEDGKVLLYTHGGAHVLARKKMREFLHEYLGMRGPQPMKGGSR